jgi:hypothetical protein
MRRDGGRPPPCARPRASVAREFSADITVLLVEKEPGPTVDALRHIVRKHDDPRQRYVEGLRFLSAVYYQHPERFDNQLAALFSAGSPVARVLAEEGRCLLNFQQDGMGYEATCAIKELEERDAAYQATYWHNRIFSPDLPSAIRLLAFLPERFQEVV